MLHYRPRVEERTPIMLRARLRGAGPEREACIVDVSSGGLAATVERPPRPGVHVELVVGDIVLIGQVKWSNVRRFGMQFRERISVDGLMDGESEESSLNRIWAQLRRKARTILQKARALFGRKVL